MTPPNLPVGACGDAAPTGDVLSEVARARGVLQVEAETLRQERDELARTIEVMLSALAGGAQWEIDTARHLAGQALAYLKDYQ
ncbi:hypothetical protein [Dietzia sp. ANT_WB102]|uniref:hypothetical protein n=1 Tax=Dietzia sp. ANT_WB102 TaxID=2597345 RepID=UPI0011EF06A9|nr:hypothetical protein [Dietzia sp. ANT_WB102]KAA0916435.1 hypothetical protein FQ137_14520 [Dietzia sp. ANT_WB102]